MKTKIFAVLTMGLAVVLMGAAPNSNNNKRSRTPQPNTGAYFCGYYTNCGQGRPSMRGRRMYGPTDSTFVCPYFHDAQPQRQRKGK